MGILSQYGISHTAEREKNDYYATDPLRRLNTRRNL